MLRRTPLKRRRSKPRRGPERDPGYLDAVRCLPCCARSAREGEECRGRVEAHHAGARGLGQKCSDREAIPLCWLCHRHWHAGTGKFKDMDKAARRLWALLAITNTQNTLAAQAEFLAGEVAF